VINQAHLAGWLFLSVRVKCVVVGLPFANLIISAQFLCQKMSPTDKPTEPAIIQVFEIICIIFYGKLFCPDELTILKIEQINLHNMKDNSQYVRKKREKFLLGLLRKSIFVHITLCECVKCGKNHAFIIFAIASVYDHYDQTFSRPRNPPTN
jgi:hypothetical protein